MGWHHQGGGHGMQCAPCRTDKLSSRKQSPAGIDAGPAGIDAWTPNSSRQWSQAGAEVCQGSGTQVAGTRPSTLAISARFSSMSRAISNLIHIVHVGSEAMPLLLMRGDRTGVSSQQGVSIGSGSAHHEVGSWDPGRRTQAGVSAYKEGVELENWEPPCWALGEGAGQIDARVPELDSVQATTTSTTRSVLWSENNVLNTHRVPPPFGLRSHDTDSRRAVRVFDYTSRVFLGPGPSPAKDCNPSDEGGGSPSPCFLPTPPPQGESEVSSKEGCPLWSGASLQPKIPAKTVKGVGKVPSSFPGPAAGTSSSSIMISTANAFRPTEEKKTKETDVLKAKRLSEKDNSARQLNREWAKQSKHLLSMLRNRE